MMCRVLSGGLLPLVLVVSLHAEDKPASKAKNAGFESMKKLAGEWIAVADQGKPTAAVVSAFKLTSAGNTIQETLFPGQAHEMVTMYTIDGSDMILTHYCAMGNQPKLKLDPKSPEKVLKFDFTGGTNLDPAKDMHMHEGSITLVDDDHINVSWQGYNGGKPDTSHKMEMKLVRKK